MTNNVYANMADEINERAARRAARDYDGPCIGNDPSCPCNDGDACHYKDTPTTKAMPLPSGEGTRRRATRDEEHDDYVAGIFRDADEVRAYIEAKVETKDVHCVLGHALSMLASYLGDEKDTARIHRKLFAEWRASRPAPSAKG